jgi:chromosome segregation ATPase
MSNVNRIKILERKISNAQKRLSRHERLINARISRFEKLLTKIRSSDKRQQIQSRLDELKSRETGQLNIKRKRIEDEIKQYQDEIAQLQTEDGGPN